MSFWNLSDNENAQETGNSFESGGGNMDPIPAGTQVKATIDEVKWDEYQGSRFISARWNVIDGEYKNRKVFHKIRVADDDPKKADKAKRMLAAIVTNAGGGLFKVQGEPTDQDLQQHLLHKPMACMLQVWEMDKDDGSKISGNWVSAVAPLSSGSSSPAPASNEDDDDPFA